MTDRLRQGLRIFDTQEFSPRRQEFEALNSDGRFVPAIEPTTRAG